MKVKRVEGLQCDFTILQYRCIPNNDIPIELRGNTLFATLPGQQYELEPMRNTEFGLKGLAGFSAIFVLGEDGVPTEAQLHRPNGMFTGERKEE